MFTKEKEACMKIVGHCFVLMIATLVWSQASNTYVFTDVSSQAGITATHRAVWEPDTTREGYLAVGQAWADYNNDSWIDLYVTGNLGDNVLYKNNGDGTFSVSELSSQVNPEAQSGGAIWADYDNDGWKDLYVLNFGKNSLFHNDEGKGFTDVTDVAGVGDTGKGESATWGDYDDDGFLDLYVVNWACLPECGAELLQLYRDRLYHNNGDGTFTDVTDSLDFINTVGAGFAASFVDYDDDGDVDLYVVNDKMSNAIGNVLWRNDGAGCDSWCWTNVSEESKADSMMHGMGLAVGDYDNDSDLDFYTTTMVSPMVLLQNENGTFKDVALEAGVGVNPGNAVGWGTAFFDFDNDGWQDLYLATTGMPPGPPPHYSGTQPDMEDFHYTYPDALLRNNGDGTFTNVSEQTLSNNNHATKGIAYADYDKDGWLDFVVGNWNEGYSLYRNEGGKHSSNQWLSVQLTGGSAVNRDAVGARVYLTTTDGRTQMQEVISGSGLGAGNDLALHFGLGQSDIQELKVVWPNGEERTFNDVTANQSWQLTYDNEAQP
jgi:enediyne biosynthesis protein E4